MRFSLKAMLWGTLLLAVIIVGVLAMFPQPLDVQAVPAQHGVLRVTVQEDGKTRIREKYTVSSPVAGRLSRIEWKAGDPINAGDVLAVILPSDPAMLDQRTRAEATARVQAGEAAVLRAESRARQAQIDLELDQSQFERVQRMMTTGAASQDEFDIARAEKLAAAQAIETAAFDAEIAKFELKLAEAALDQFSGDQGEELQVEPFEIDAPISGRVLRVMQQSSTVVAVGTDLIEVGDPSNLEMEIDVLSTDAVKIWPGAEVTVEHWGGDASLRGTVRVVEPGAFTKTSSLGVEEQRVNVIADFDETAARIASLGDGYRIEASITVDEIARALRIPNSALFRHEHAWHVLVAQEGIAELRPVEIGLQNESQTQITTGLSEGERVIEYPSEQLKPGTLVRVVP